MASVLLAVVTGKVNRLFVSFLSPQFLPLRRLYVLCPAAAGLLSDWIRFTHLGLMSCFPRHLQRILPVYHLSVDFVYNVSCHTQASCFQVCPSVWGCYKALSFSHQLGSPLAPSGQAVRRPQLGVLRGPSVSSHGICVKVPWGHCGLEDSTFLPSETKKAPQTLSETGQTWSPHLQDCCVTQCDQQKLWNHRQPYALVVHSALQACFLIWNTGTQQCPARGAAGRGHETAAARRAQGSRCQDLLHDGTGLPEGRKGTQSSQDVIKPLQGPHWERATRDSILETSGSAFRDNRINALRLTGPLCWVGEGQGARSSAPSTWLPNSSAVQTSSWEVRERL